MALPGKLCIGILEEDNPQKSYFRFKPLLAAENGSFIFYEVGDEFPENGCLRIVPDKNESSRFKARMRRMGRYGMVDLREHPDENDKIRPNKNYRGDDVETNACIIYSDVVREVPEGMLAEIIAQDAPDDSAQLAIKTDMPGTPQVLLSGCNPAGALWTCAPIEDIDGGLSLRRTGAVIDEENAQRFDVPGFSGETLSFMIARPGTMLYTPQPEASEAPEALPLPAAQTQAAPTPAPAPEAPKPWIHRDESMLPRPVDPSLGPREQSLAMQTGLNPRRGRSLQEIIDDKWRKSRMDQLGHPSNDTVTGKPVFSPVDRAVDAVRSAWEHTQARPCIARAMSQIDGLGEAMATGASQLESEAHAAKLKAFEEAREQLSGEINALRQEHDRLRQEMSDSLHLEMQEELEAHRERIGEMEKLEGDIKARAEDARMAAEAAKQAIGRLTDQELTRRLSEYAVNCRAADILMNMRTGAFRAAHAEKTEPNETISLPQLTARVRIHFAAAGFPISADEAVNLLACMALDGYVLFTGPVGCGKTAYARLLCEALGLDRAGCVFEYGEGAEYDDVPVGLTRVVLADDVNVSRDSAGELIARFDGKGGEKLIITAQDSATGRPLDPRVLDRSFMIRIDAPESNSPWERASGAKKDKYSDVITAGAIKALFPMEGRSVAPQVLRAMAALRSALADYGVRLSRRTLDGMWAFCAAVTPHLEISPMEAFDLAFAQRALPSILAGAPVEALHALPRLLKNMPKSLGLLKQPLAIEI